MSIEKVRKSVGMEYYYYILRMIWGVLIFYLWSQSVNLFYETGLDLFWDLFLIMFFSGIIARFIAYLFLYLPRIITKIFQKKGRYFTVVPGLYELTFKPNINRLSLILILGTLICCLIYALGIDQYIIDYFFPEQNLWSTVMGYLFIKIGAYVIAWAFFKIKRP